MDPDLEDDYGDGDIPEVDLPRDNVDSEELDKSGCNSNPRWLSSVS